MKKFDTTMLERNVFGLMMHDKESLPKLLDCIKDDWINTDSRKFIFEKIKEAYLKTQSTISKETLFYDVERKFDDEFEDNKIKEYKKEIDIIAKTNSTENIDFIIGKFQEAESAEKLSNMLEESYMDLEKGELKLAYKTVMEHQDNPISLANQHIPPIADYLDDYISCLGDGSRKMTGLKTGLESYDEQLSGINGLTILGGSPGAGKTAFVCQLSCGCAENGIPVLFYSLEMGRNQIINRNVCRYSDVEAQEIMLDGRLYFDANCNSLKRPNAEIKSKLNDAFEKLKTISDRYTIMTVEDERPMDFDVLKSDILKAKEDFKTDKILVIIDHLQIFPISGRFGNTIDKENYLITNFKRIHTQTKVPMILLSQQNKVALKSNNAELGAIKGSVDNIYTPDVVLSLIDTTPKDQGNFVGEYKSINLHVIKNRNGRSDFYIPLDFRGKYFQFSEPKTDNGGDV